MRKNLVLVIILMLPALFVLFAGIVSAQPGPPPGGPALDTVVVLDTVRPTVPVIAKKYTGVFTPIEQVKSIARVSGKITNIAFQEGQMVKKGDMLFEIEPEEWQAKYDAAQAAVESSEASIAQFEAKIKEIDAQIKYKESSYKRNLDLYEQSKAVSKDDLENALSLLETAQAQKLATQAQLKESQASLKSARANLALTKLDLDRTKIRAEITGKAGKLTYTLGNYVTSGSEPLITISQMDPIYVRFTVSERDFTDLFEKVENLTEAELVHVTLADGKDYEHRGKIAFYDNQIDTATDSITIWTQLPNPKGILSPGGIAKVSVEIPAGAAMPSVPLTALVRDIQGVYVFVVGKNGIASIRRIEPGLEFGDIQCVKSGLSNGETIVSDGTHKVMDGMPVVGESQKKPSPVRKGGSAQ